MVAKNAELCPSLEKRCDDAITAFIGYFLLAAATIHFTSDGRNHATIWVADALILGLLLHGSKKQWPAILIAGWIGNFMANAVTRDWAPGIVAYGAINMVQTGLTAWFISSTSKCNNPLTDTSSTVRFLVYAGLVGPLLGATLGSIATIFTFAEPFWPSFVRWYVSNALGMLIVTPFVMAVLDGSYLRCFAERTPASRLEAIGLHVIHLVVTCLVFAQGVMPLLFLPVSTVLVISFRLGRLGTILGAMVVALVGAVAIIIGVGPISHMHFSIGDQEILYQFYLGNLLAITLPVAAMMSSRANALELLNEREAALRLMMAYSSNGILSFDMAGICQWAEGPMADYLGMDGEALLGKSLDAMSLHSPQLAQRVKARLDAGDDGDALFEFSSLLRPELTLEATVGRLRRGDAVIGTVMTVRDVTRRKANDAVLVSKAQTDELTGLSNRTGFRKHLRSALADPSRPTTLALVNVDRFRLINDVHGQMVGDAVLVELAKRMKAAIRKEDSVSRIGGDEFAIVLRCDRVTALGVCRRMADSIREEVVFSDGVVSVLTSVSCGLAQHHAGMSRDEVFDAAEVALYNVKNSGRNNVLAVA